MGVSKIPVGHRSLLVGVALLALVAGTASARTAPAEPDAGREPTGGAPILYNPTPAEKASVPRQELSRAAATIETRRQAGVARAAIYVDGRRREAELMGPTPHQQTVSTDIGDLAPGVHTVKVKAVDSDGQAGGHAWEFTVL
jgi:hypothetical protein